MSCFQSGRRVAMFACLGYIVPEYFRWPGYLSPEKGIKFADVPAGLAAVSKVPLEGWAQIALFLGHYEGYFWRQDAKRAPGDYEGDSEVVKESMSFSLPEMVT